MRGRAVADLAAWHVGGVARCILTSLPRPCFRPGIGSCGDSSDPSPQQPRPIPHGWFCNTASRSGCTRWEMMATTLPVHLLAEVVIRAQRTRPQIQ